MLRAFAGTPLCGAVCANCLEKCTYFFVYVNDDLRNVPKRVRKTVTDALPRLCVLSFISSNILRNSAEYKCEHNIAMGHNIQTYTLVNHQHRAWQLENGLLVLLVSWHKTVF